MRLKLQDRTVSALEKLASLERARIQTGKEKLLGIANAKIRIERDIEDAEEEILAIEQAIAKMKEVRHDRKAGIGTGKKRKPKQRLPRDRGE